MMGMVEGKVALVTGAAAGIGRASALLFAQEGATVVVSDVDTQGGEETTALIHAAGGTASFLRCDVNDAADVEGLVRETVARYGRLDCAHNNAGISGTLVRTAELSDADFDQTMSVNLRGVWLCLKHEIAQMLQQGGGTIVNTSSGAGLVGIPHASAYTASKHGVVGLTRSVALEYVRDGIRVNAICPGMVRTPMVASIPPDLMAQYEQTQPIGRLAEPDEIAQAAIWLCSARASFVTGVALAVDGGSTID
jgi:NAD(P)-dependent dehydrogenase (short-subunit alcohol dehydrogenase family)